MKCYEKKKQSQYGSQAPKYIYDKELRKTVETQHVNED